MNLNGDRDRFLIALAAAVVFHIGIAIGMTFVDWSSPPRSTTLTVDLGAPVETEIPEVDPESMEEDEPEERDPEEPDEPDEPEDPEDSEEPEPPDPEEFEPADTQAGSETESPDSAEPDPSDEPPTTPRPQGPSYEDLDEEGRRQLGLDDGDEQRERPERSPSDPQPTIDSDRVTQRRQEAREEFSRLLEQEEQRRTAASDEDGDEEAEAGGDPDTQVSALVYGALGRVTDASADSSAPPGSDDSGDSDATTGEETTDVDANGDDSSNDDSGGGNDDPDGPGDDIVTWEGEGDRALVQFSLPEMDGSDLRASGAPEVLARISFDVDERGIVLPGRVTVRAPGLTIEGRSKIRDAVAEWRFESRRGAGTAQGSVDFIFQRSGSD